MLFSSPIKSLDGGYLKSTCTEMKVADSESLAALENEIIGIITEKSQEWFKRSFTLEQIVSKFNKQTFEKGLVIKGILFYKDKFELDSYVEEEIVSEQKQEAQDFFEELTEPTEPTEPVQAPEVKEEFFEPEQAQEQAQEQDQPPVLNQPKPPKQRPSPQQPQQMHFCAPDNQSGHSGQQQQRPVFQTRGIGSGQNPAGCD